MNLIFKCIMIMGVFLLSGCELFEDSLAKQEKQQELALKTLQVQQESGLAHIKMQESLALIEKEKLLSLAKMDNDIRAKELETKSEKELELIKQKLALQESNNLLDFQKYLLIFLGILIFIITVFVFYYMKKKREDELRAYNDNIKKYFYMKENESRMKIAEKILDTIADSDLSAENEQKLINAFTKEQPDPADDAEIIEVLEDKREDNGVN